MANWWLSKGPILAAGLLCAFGASAQPAPEDPDWPCVQRKVENLSLGLMWPHAVPEESELTGDERVLVETLALRRVGLDQAEAEVTAYMSAHPDTGIEELGLIFQGVFDRLAAERRRIIGGIERYADGQHELAARIDASRAAFA
jgi:hypothetical protein